MALEVHLHECFLHVLDMGRRILDEPLPMTEVGSQASDVFTRPEACFQQTELMELLEPLGIVVVCFPEEDCFDGMAASL
jgi:hypothetical protein